MHLNLKISNFSIQYYYSSTTINRIGHIQKPCKGKSHQPLVTNGPLSTYSLTSNSHYKSNKNIDVESK